MLKIYVSKEQLEDLYIKQNLSIKEISDILKISKSTVSRFIKSYTLFKSKELRIICQERLYFQKTGYKHPASNPLVINKMKQNNLEKYGVENQFQRKDVKEKLKLTVKLKYGVDNISQVDETKEKKRSTKLKHYGDENYNNREKAKVTIIQRYGVDNYTKTEEYLEKTKKTNLERYGVENPLKSKEIKEKVKETCFDRYGVDNVRKSKEIYDKMKRTMLERYGVSNPSQNADIQQKKFDTMKKNNSYNTSKPEEQIAELLLTKFPDTIRQYKSEPYPFICDFYIPSLDLYIEYQGTWTHGKEPFDFYNPEHLVILGKWKKKATLSKFYRGAVNVWTRRDPLKREVAKKNNLNWLEFFTFEEFTEWFNQLK